MGTSSKILLQTESWKKPQGWVGHRVRASRERRQSARSTRGARPRLGSRLAEVVVFLDKSTSPFPSPSMLGRASSPSRVRCPAPTTCALTAAGARPRRISHEGKGL